MLHATLCLLWAAPVGEYLRHCRQDAAKHRWAILALLVKALRQQWLEVEILFRGDRGFCHHWMLD
ncbi:transposase [Microbulbifer sp. 2304DJ12-6]|uniref:transposase n=1 Tax=Microbulbifer sp. 2304DJ12-6 TaxID=3233340 RepID=UPI0039AE98FD